MKRIGGKAVGVTGLLLRLVFGASIAFAAYGFYIATIKALMPRDAVHLRIVGMEILGIGFAVSLVAFWLLLLPGLHKSVQSIWYLTAQGLLVGTVITLLYVFAVARAAVDWQRSPATVTAVARQCSTSTDSEGSDSYLCDLRWTWKGVVHEQVRGTNGNYPAGTEVVLHVDTETGGADDHAIASFVWLSFFWLPVAAGTVVWWVDTIRELASAPRRPVPWLRAMGVLDTPARPEPPRTPEDAIPAQSQSHVEPEPRDATP